ncbi:unnamed protein product [Linum tenue]|uniref:Uncharacterized protein n=2 Tax=Linum tenue TaxID=586396 RepID=A0AAV0LDF4_9ROSI|nr:unnamed protein product [Linum tenue]
MFIFFNFWGFHEAKGVVDIFDALLASVVMAKVPMERYYSRQVQSTPNVQTEGVEASGSRQAQTFPPSSTVGAPQIQEPNLSGSVNRTPEESESFSAESDREFDENSLVLDPALRTKISSFHPNVRDQVRRFYLQKGPIQPKSHSFPARNFSGR